MVRDKLEGPGLELGRQRCSVRGMGWKGLRFELESGFDLQAMGRLRFSVSVMHG